MNVVVVDGGALSPQADFPPLALDKFGWQQFVRLDDNELAERCWRSDVIVSVATPIDRAVIDGAFKLKLIVAAGERVDHIDLEAARKRNITVCNIPGMSPSGAAEDQRLCEQVIETINSYISGNPQNQV